MVFPQTPLDVVVEMEIGGTWTDVTDFVYARAPITIERGRKDEGKQTDPARCSLTLDNRDGRWSSRNPASPYFGLIGRNTPVRVSLDVGESYLSLPGNAGDKVTTPDVAALDITGDIDVRFEMNLTNWTSLVLIAGKYEITGNQRSWGIWLNTTGTFNFRWTTAGTLASAVDATCTEPLPYPPGGRPVAVRVTLDVDNGASGNTVTFYTSDSIDGTWTQLGEPIVNSGTTSIHSGTAPVELGDIDDFLADACSGRITKFQILDGIGGTVVANPDFTVQTPGDTSFTDGAGLEWTVAGGASISNRKPRFVGEISSWPVRWDVSGEDVEVSVEAAGILRRLGQGAVPLKSALERHITVNGAIECWPLTDGKLATHGTALFGGAPMVPKIQSGTGSVGWAEGKLADWLDPVVLTPPSTDGTLGTYVPNNTDAASEWSVDICRSGIGDYEGLVIGDQGSGTDASPKINWTIEFDAGADEIWLSAAYISESSSSVDVVETVSNAGIYDDAPHHVRVTITPGATDTDYELYVDGAARTSGTYTGEVSQAVRNMRLFWTNLALTDDLASFGYITYWGPNPPAVTDTYDAVLGNAGERATERVLRLCNETDVTMRPAGRPEESTPLGPQGRQTFTNIVEAAAQAESGILYEDREDVALRLRDHAGLYNQTVALDLDYSTGDVAPPLEPVDDDQSTRNDVTVTRTGGGWARVTKDTGPLSTDAPPDGVGTYSESVSLDLYTDNQPISHAGWRVHLGTWDEARYPVVRVDLAATPDLVDTASGADIGDRMTISNPPVWLPDETIDLLVQGYTEVITHPNGWELAFNCSPAGPWTVGIPDDDVLGRVDNESCVTNGSTSSSSGILNVLTATGSVRWADSATYSGDFPFDIYVGGEVMRVTSCSGTAQSQTFGVTRSINGVVKAHASGTPVRLITTPVIAL
ncbi:hypothetical protein [Streptomyces sp. NPDC049887]|uniref:hypothetical protein n=1 Tax=Streptomyces sp. NPDC049887 TaxID=3155654 RepID=UPI003421ECC4